MPWSMIFVDQTSQADGSRLLGRASTSTDGKNAGAFDIEGYLEQYQTAQLQKTVGTSNCY